MKRLSICPQCISGRRLAKVLEPEISEEVDQKRRRNCGLAHRGSIQARNLARRVKSVARPVIADRTGSLHTCGTPFKVSKEFRVNRESTGFSRAATVMGGGSLIAATLLFSAVFVVLARTFGYPDVLDLPAAQVLPRRLALGPGGRAVWVLYGLIPLLLLPTAIGVYAAGRHAAPLAARTALILALLTAAAMMAGLLRWPSLHWQLALAYADASPAAREAI
ncbi:MAG: hypothetical protein ABL878_19250, partial [Burkholderiales bacterium]